MGGVKGDAIDALDDQAPMLAFVLAGPGDERDDLGILFRKKTTTEVHMTRHVTFLN